MIQPVYRLTNKDVYGPEGRLDAWSWTWQPGDAPEGARAVTARDAVAHLSRSGARRIPVGVIGPRAYEYRMAIF